MAALDAHNAMSTPALKSQKVQEGLTDVLLNHAGLYQALRGNLSHPGCSSREAPCHARPRTHFQAGAMGTDYYNADRGSLTSLLEFMLSEYERDYRDYWGMDGDAPPNDLGADDWRLAKSLDEVGRAALESVHALSIAPSMHPVLEAIQPGGKRTEALREAASYNITLHGLEIELARLAVDRVPMAAMRVQELVLLVSNAKFSPRAGAYVDRATKLYIWGFDLECIVMCRSILEVALQARIEDAQMTSLGFRKRGANFALLDYIRGAERLHIFESQEREWANEVRIAGNDALHVTPGIQPTAFDTLLNVALLVRKLFPV